MSLVYFITSLSRFRGILLGSLKHIELLKIFRVGSGSDSCVPSDLFSCYDHDLSRLSIDNDKIVWYIDYLLAVWRGLRFSVWTTPSIAGIEITINYQHWKEGPTIYINRHISIHIGGSRKLTSVYQRICCWAEYSTGNSSGVNIGTTTAEINAPSDTFCGSRLWVRDELYLSWWLSWRLSRPSATKLISMLRLSSKNVRDAGK